MRHVRYHRMFIALAVEHFGTERSAGNGRDRSGNDCAGIPCFRHHSVTDGNGWDRE